MAKKLIGLFLFFVMLLLVSCTGATGNLPETAAPTAVSGTDTPALATAVPTTDIPATNTAPPPVPSATAVPSEADLSLEAADVFLYPVPDIYTGDRVTFQVLAHVPSSIDPRNVTVHILVNYQDVVEGTLSARNLAGNAMGLFEWAWDTADATGDQLVHVILDRYDTISEGDENRDNNEVALTIPVLDPQTLPQNEQGATWVTAETDCCNVHVVSGTAAYRDLPEILVMVETAVAQASTNLEEDLGRKIVKTVYEQCRCRRRFTFLLPEPYYC